MNEENRDPELRSVGSEWMAPAPSGGFHSRVLSAFDREFGHVRWWRRWLVAMQPGGKQTAFVGMGVAICVSLLVAIQAFPQMLGAGSIPPGTPWTIDSEFVRYAEDGSSSVEMYSTSFAFQSHEILLSRSMPGNPFMTALGRTLDVVGPAWSRLMIPFMVDAETLAKLRRVRQEGLSLITGCTTPGCIAVDHFGWAKTQAAVGACIDGKVVDREMILGHPTEAVQRRWTEHGRMTLWMAPDMACFALRVTYEAQRPDGTFHLVSAKRALRINSLSHP